MLGMSRRASASLQIMVCLLLGSLSHAAEPAKDVQWPRIHSAVAADPVLEAKVASLVKQMTLEAKIGQMVQPDIRDVTPDDVRKYRLGSILNGGGAFVRHNKKAEVEESGGLFCQHYDASMDISAGV